MPADSYVQDGEASQRLSSPSRGSSLHVNDSDEQPKSRLDTLSESLQALSGESASLGDRIAVSTARIEAIEEHFQALKKHTENAIAGIEDRISLDCCGSQFAAKASELHNDVNGLDAQGRELYNELKQQGWQRARFEEIVDQRLQVLEKHLEETANTDVPRVEKDLRRLREALDVETMVREDVDVRLQGLASDNEALRKMTSDSIADVQARLDSSVADCCQQLARLSLEQGALSDEVVLLTSLHC
jgi:hypothetical protein